MKLATGELFSAQKLEECNIKATESKKRAAYRLNTSPVLARY